MKSLQAALLKAKVIDSDDVERVRKHDRGAPARRAWQLQRLREGREKREAAAKSRREAEAFRDARSQAWQKLRKRLRSYADD